jgi:hypothetical protein
MEQIWSTQIELHFVSSQARDGFGQHMLRFILCHRYHRMSLINTCRDAVSVLTGKEGVYSTHVEIHYVASLAWGGFWLTRVGINFVSSLACGGFGHHMLRFILCPRCHGMGLVNTCSDAYCVFAGI